MSYLGTLAALEILYFSIFVVLVGSIAQAWTLLGLPAPGRYFLAIVAPLYFAASWIAYTVAGFMHTDSVGFMEAHRRTFAHVRSLLPFLPLVGHLFGSERYLPRDPES